ncbi:MAG: hypothetical protein D5S03_06325 [Desulfonatronospira sp. MSAO_Bac3]|nr:MAG: hypothetical protein D5S03_06325 [Desulfonatronospira sp. MSAO_Bac3]
MISFFAEKIKIMPDRMMWIRRCRSGLAGTDNACLTMGALTLPPAWAKINSSYSIASLGR